MWPPTGGNFPNWEIRPLTENLPTIKMTEQKKKKKKVIEQNQLNPTMAESVVLLRILCPNFSVTNFYFILFSFLFLPLNLL